jgi:ABC-type transporter Mla subunit MlaD
MTLQQTVTATEMTDAIDALAATSASIAETVGEVVAKAGTLRENIQRAKTDLQSSTDALADKSEEVAPIATRHKAGAEMVKQTIQVMAESFPQPRSGYVDGQR